MLDTNVLIYALDAESKFHASAAELLTDTGYELVISTKTVSEYFAVTSKLDVSIEVAIGFYNQIKKNVSLAFPDSNSLFTFESLYKKYKPKGNRVFDLEIVSIALANGINELATANLKDLDSITEINLVPLLAE